MKTTRRAASLALSLLAAPALAQDAPFQGIEAVGATAQTAADHVAIAELTSLFEVAFDEGDIDAHMATWADEMSFASPFGDFETREGYREWVEGFYERTSGMGGTRHLITNAVVALDGNLASQTAYLVIVGRTLNDGAPGLMATVRFEDALARTPEGWRFTARTLHLDQDPALFDGR